MSIYIYKYIYIYICKFQCLLLAAAQAKKNIIFDIQSFSLYPAVGNACTQGAARQERSEPTRGRIVTGLARGQPPSRRIVGADTSLLRAREVSRVWVAHQ